MIGSRDVWYTRKGSTILKKKLGDYKGKGELVANFVDPEDAKFVALVFAAVTEKRLDIDSLLELRQLYISREKK